jgi:hypothetical protein
MLNEPIVTAPSRTKYDFPIGPQYVWADDATSNFIKQLGLEIPIREVKVGYYYQDKFRTFCEPLKELYDLKVYGRRMEGSMSRGQPCFKAFDISFSEFEQLLREKVRDRIIEDKIVGIEKRKLIGEEGEYRFDILTSTIPLPELLSMLGLPNDGLKYRSIISVLVETYAPEIWDNIYEIIYFPGLEVIPYRVTKLEYPKVVYEFLNPEPLTLPFKGEPLGIRIKQYGKIIDGKPPVEQLWKRRIRLLGRFAQWDRKIMVGDVIRRVEEWVSMP